MTSKTDKDGNIILDYLTFLLKQLCNFNLDKVVF